MDEVKEYTSSKEDVSRAILDFVRGEEVEVVDEATGHWIKGHLEDIHIFKPCPYDLQSFDRSSKIRKLQITEPVNPYADIEENGTFKVVEAELEGGHYYYAKYNGVQHNLGDWINHKDFAGYVFKIDNEYIVYSECWQPNLGHAIGVILKVGE